MGREQRARLRLLEAGLQRSINDLESVSKTSAVEALHHGDCGVDVDVDNDMELGSSISAALAYADGSPSPHKHGFKSGAISASSSSSEDEDDDNIARRIVVTSSKLSAAAASASSQTRAMGKSSSPAAPTKTLNQKRSTQMTSFPRHSAPPAVEHSAEEREFYSEFMKRDQERRARMANKTTTVRQSHSRTRRCDLMDTGKDGGTKAWVSAAPAGSARDVATARRAVFAASHGDSPVEGGHSESDDSVEAGETKSWLSPTPSLRSAQGQRRQVPSGWASKQHSREQQRRQQLKQHGSSPQTRQHEQQQQRRQYQLASSHTLAPAPATASAHAHVPAHAPAEAPAVDTEASKVAWVRREYARQLQALSSDVEAETAEASGTESDEFDPTSAQSCREVVAKVSGAKVTGVKMLHSASDTQLDMEQRAAAPQLSKSSSSRRMPVSMQTRPGRVTPSGGLHVMKDDDAAPQPLQRKYAPAGQKSQSGKRIAALKQRGTAPAVGGFSTGTTSFKPGQRICVKPRGRRERRAAAAAAAAGQHQL